MSTIKLLKEQALIIDTLQKFRCLRESQVRVILTYLYNKKLIDKLNLSEDDSSEEYIDKYFLDEYIDNIMGILVRKGMIYKNNGYYKIHESIDHNDYHGMIMSFWAYLSFIDKVDLKESLPGSYPLDIFFIKDKEQFGAIYIKKGSEYLVNMLIQEEKEKNRSLKDSGLDGLKTNYVIGVDSVDTIKKIISYPSLEKSDFENVLFVIMTFKDRAEEPDRKFVKA